jgi:hypothetical protein
MKRFTLFFTMLVLFVGCQRAPKTCQVCQRDECRGLAFRITLTTGKTVETCCPRCGLYYLATAKQRAQSLAATDLSSGQWIDASKAVYVSGSAISPCASMEAKRDAYGCCAVKDFDRCLPSLIGFGTTAAAAAFQKQHGGELLTWEQIQPSK